MNKEELPVSSFEAELERHGTLVYSNVGKSMLPLIREHRDLMVIKKRPEGRLKKHDAVLYRIGDKYILHRIIKVEENGYVIRGDNTFVNEYGITDEHIIGVLDSVVRDGKTVEVSDFGYRMYVGIWCGIYPLRYFHVKAKRFCRRGIGFVRRRLAKIVGMKRKRGK